MKSTAPRTIPVVAALGVVLLGAALWIERGTQPFSGARAWVASFLPSKPLSSHTAPHPISAPSMPALAASSHSSPVPLPMTRLASQESATGTRILGNEPQRLVDGVEAVKAIDWSRVHSLSPIPRGLPTGEAMDAVDAGFVPEWFERSMEGAGANSLRVRGQFSSIAIQPLAERILSESKSAEDAWANGVESELRTVIANHTAPGVEVISRVFCNGEGCLCYLENADPSLARPASAVMLALRDEPWAKTYGIDPLSFYRLGTRGWDLILITRPK